MRCLLCQTISLRLLCADCDRALAPAPRIHDLQDLKLISFYDYDDVEPLTWAKYHPFGSLVLKRLAIKAFRPFFRDLSLEQKTAIVPIDDHISRFFSHTAVLAKYAAAGRTTARFGALRAQSHEKYAGQTLAFRRAHPRRFVCKPFAENATILIDDLSTTGTTLLEASEAIQKSGKSVLFAVTLSKAH